MIAIPVACRRLKVFRIVVVRKVCRVAPDEHDGSGCAPFPSELRVLRKSRHNSCHPSLLKPRPCETLPTTPKVPVVRFVVDRTHPSNRTVRWQDWHRLVRYHSTRADLPEKPTSA